MKISKYTQEIFFITELYISERGLKHPLKSVAGQMLRQGR
jgi:hypothetical protein